MGVWESKELSANVDPLELQRPAHRVTKRKCHVSKAGTGDTINQIRSRRKKQTELHSNCKRHARRATELRSLVVEADVLCFDRHAAGYENHSCKTLSHPPVRNILWRPRLKCLPQGVNMYVHVIGRYSLLRHTSFFHIRQDF